MKKVLEITLEIIAVALVTKGIDSVLEKRRIRREIIDLVDDVKKENQKKCTSHSEISEKAAL
jgi:hypothetical protein